MSVWVSSRYMVEIWLLWIVIDFKERAMKQSFGQSVGFKKNQTIYEVFSTRN